LPGTRGAELQAGHDPATNGRRASTSPGALLEYDPRETLHGPRPSGTAPR
jgi:hypothetical protein